MPGAWAKLSLPPAGRMAYPPRLRFGEVSGAPFVGRAGPG